MRVAKNCLEVRDWGIIWDIAYLKFIKIGFRSEYNFFAPVKNLFKKINIHYYYNEYLSCTFYIYYTKNWNGRYLYYIVCFSSFLAKLLSKSFGHHQNITPPVHCLVLPISFQFLNIIFFIILYILKFLKFLNQYLNVRINYHCLNDFSFQA